MQFEPKLESFGNYHFPSTENSNSVATCYGNSL